MPSKNKDRPKHLAAATGALCVATLYSSPRSLAFSEPAQTSPIAYGMLHGSVEQNQPGLISLRGGEMLAVANSNMEIDAGDCTVLLSQGTIALIERRPEGVVKVKSLFDNHGRSVRVETTNRKLSLAIGEEGIVSPTATDNIVITKSEFSLSSLFAQNQLVRRLLKSKGRYSY